METLKFKTNINCGGCLKSVTPHLDKLENVNSWKVDINNPGKILEVKLNDENENAVLNAVKKAGFEIEKVEQV